MVFLKQLAATMAGIILSLVLFVVALGCVAIVVVNIATSSTMEPIKKGTLLEINMNEVILDSPRPLSLIDVVTLNTSPSTSLLSALTAIECAEKDSNITAISLMMNGMSGMSLSMASELREALTRFRERSAKPIYAYSDGYSQVEYYLATVADSLFMHPLGGVEWQGVAMTGEYYGDLLKEVGVTAEVFRPASCIYKSSVEPYTENKMSDSSREQDQRLVDEIWSSILKEVALSRGISSSALRLIARDQIIVTADDALSERMIDGVLYKDQYESALQRVGVLPRKDKEALRSVTLTSYATSVALNIEDYNASNSSKGSVAVIYMDGVIMDGDRPSATEDGVASGMVVKELRRARFDKDVKAVVVRVNSPGGSAIAADVVSREMELLRKEKPVIVSMGAYAASGGYYVSAPADVILADQYTMTGSIGVYGVMFTFEDALRRHLKINIDGVVSSPSADFGRSMRDVTPIERAAMTRGVDDVYVAFQRCVAQGRDLSPSVVAALSGGRVWSGAEAVQCGLVDALGGLSKAIGLATERSGLSGGDFEIVEYGQQLSGWESMLMQGVVGVKVGLVDDLFGDLRGLISMDRSVVALSVERVKF